MPVQVNISLLLFGGLQGIFLAVVLLNKKVHKSGYFFLVVYLAVMILQITLKVMSKIWLLDNLMPLYVLSYLFPLLYGPLIFLFVKQFLFQRSFRVIDSLHFLPLIVVISYFIFGNPYAESSLIVQPFFAPPPRLILELLSLTIYHRLAWQYWMKYQSQFKSFFSNIKKLQLKWMKQFIIISFVVCSVISAVIFLMYEWYPYNQDIRFGFITLTVFIYWISYCALNQPQVFSVINGLADDTKDVNVVPNLIVYRTLKKYSNSGLRDEEMHRIISMLEKLIEQQKLYLNSEITIDELAEKISCSKHHLSQVLNFYLQKSFYEYINTYRIEEAKMLLTNAARADHKIASIAYDAGFNSLSTFNDLFKKFTGVTPSQYRKQLAAQSRKQRV
jgi:AraC-like DNA-binding protein